MSESEQPDSAGQMHRFLGLLVILLACFVAYFPSLSGGFVWDDDTHLLLNPVFQDDGLHRVWLTPPQEINYWPVTFTTYWLEYQIWEFDPLGYRIVNLLLHALAAMVLWAVLRALSIPFAWWIALIFAVHPVNVESVAWIAQRKNVLSLLFFLLTALLYLRFEVHRRVVFYAAALGCFTLAMLSKGAAAPFPAILLLLAWWRRDTITRQDVTLALPFLVITIATSLLELSTQALVAADVVVRDDDFVTRLAGAGWVAWFYLLKVLWPSGLMFIYPRWVIDAGSIVNWLPLIAGALLLVAAWRLRAGPARHVLAALLFFLIMLSPVLGFFNIYFMRFSFVADHYQYLAMISIVALVVGGFGSLSMRFPAVPDAARYAALGAIAFSLAATSAALSANYQSEEILWRETLSKNPNTFLAHYNLAVLLQSEGRLEEAVPHYREAIRTDPTHSDALNNLGKVLQDQGQTAQAVDAYLQAIAIAPDSLDPRNNLAIVHQQQGQLEAAREQFEAALAIAPDSAVVHFNFGRLLAELGERRSALNHFRHAALLAPDSAEIQTGVARAQRELSPRGD